MFRIILHVLDWLFSWQSPTVLYEATDAPPVNTREVGGVQ